MIRRLVSVARRDGMAAGAIAEALAGCVSRMSFHSGHSNVRVLGSESRRGTSIIYSAVFRPCCRTGGSSLMTIAVKGIAPIAIKPFRPFR